MRTTALVASAFVAFLYVTMPGASALPAPARADIAATTTASPVEQVRWRRWYRPYRYYGYRPYYYRPYHYYRPYRLYYGPRYYRRFY